MDDVFGRVLGVAAEDKAGFGSFVLEVFVGEGVLGHTCRQGRGELGRVADHKRGPNLAFSGPTLTGLSQGNGRKKKPASLLAYGFTRYCRIDQKRAPAFE